MPKVQSALRIGLGLQFGEAKRCLCVGSASLLRSQNVQLRREE